VNYQRVNSSSLEAVGYDPATATLGIRFHNGREYQFRSVTQEEHGRLLAANSLGQYFAHQIRNAGYDYCRVR
jgi:KTSC domain